MKPKHRKLLCALLVLLVAAWAAGGSAQDASVLVIERSEADHAAAQRFLALSERPAALLRVAPGLDAAQPLALGRAQGTEDVVVFDHALAQVSVVRVADGAVWTRAVDPSSETPFVAAFVAVELLALSTGTNVSASPAPARTGLRWVGLRLGGHALFASPYRGSGRVELGLLGALGQEGAAFAWLFELFAAPHAHHVQALGPGRLQLARSDLAARAGALWQRRFGVGSFVQAGVSFVDATYARAHEHAVRALLGAGAEPNVQLTPWLRLYGSAVLSTTLPRGEYRFGTAGAIRDRALGLQLGGGLWFTLPLP